MGRVRGGTSTEAPPPSSCTSAACANQAPGRASPRGAASQEWSLDLPTRSPPPGLRLLEDGTLDGGPSIGSHTHGSPRPRRARAGRGEEDRAPGLGGAGEAGIRTSQSTRVTGTRSRDRVPRQHWTEGALLRETPPPGSSASSPPPSPRHSSHDQGHRPTSPRPQLRSAGLLPKGQRRLGKWPPQPTATLHPCVTTPAPLASLGEEARPSLEQP